MPLTSTFPSGVWLRQSIVSLLSLLSTIVPSSTQHQIPMPLSHMYVFVIAVPHLILKFISHSYGYCNIFPQTQRDKIVDFWFCGIFKATNPKPWYWQESTPLQTLEKNPLLASSHVIVIIPWIVASSYYSVLFWQLPLCIYNLPLLLSFKDNFDDPSGLSIITSWFSEPKFNYNLTYLPDRIR